MNAMLDLKGVRILDIDLRPDERGFFAEVLREDCQEYLDNDWIAQVNLSYSHPDTVRAWHCHARGQVDHFLALQGAVKVCAYDDQENSSTKGRLVEIILSEKRPQLVRIPGNYWHGTKTVSSTPALVVYFVNRLYDKENPDEQRRPWNDSKLIPLAINGKLNDPRVGKPWDWFYPKHK
ncbi:MAG TPA: dTDP-4-dehydrorhamnose 3,5-epimerase family protein [Candidatus Bathyarchaeia archaeon]|nr:dTDP-4-dehydrorhamnose 3,5-epimerase family protein [Candidatus Bathyarchaeia archaeon]